MVNLELLNMGRKFGYENLLEIQNLKRGLKRNPSGTFKAHIESDRKSMDSYYAALQNNSNIVASMIANKTIGIMKEMTPRTFGENMKSTTDLTVNKLSEKTGSISVKSVSKDEKGIIAQFEMNALKNDSEMAIKAKGNAENMSIDYDVVMTDPEKFDGEFKSFKEIVTGLNYQENEGMSKLGFNIKDAGMVKKANINMEAPTAFLNKMAEMQQGENVTFKSQIDTIKQQLSNNME